METNHILVVEDDKEIREGIKIYLLSQGYQVFLAADGIWWAVVLAEALASAVSAVFLCKTHRSIRAAG